MWLTIVTTEALTHQTHESGLNKDSIRIYPDISGSEFNLNCNPAAQLQETIECYVNKTKRRVRQPLCCKKLRKGINSDHKFTIYNSIICFCTCYDLYRSTAWRFVSTWSTHCFGSLPREPLDGWVRLYLAWPHCIVLRYTFGNLCSKRSELVKRTLDQWKQSLWGKSSVR